MSRYFVFTILAVLCGALILSSGCLQQQKDAQGCIVGEESWCPTEHRCIQVGTETCEAPTITSFEECVAAGYSVMESYPRQCRVPAGPTFVEDIFPQQCEQAGGHWNECSNRCHLENAGRSDYACSAVCEALCECAGIAGFRCPEGYTCRTPAGVPDALGYCIQEGTSVANLTEEAAMEIARNSTCAQEGNLTESIFYNPVTHTWWINLEPFTPNPLCNLSCVVDDATSAAEVIPLCTGAIPPLDEGDLLNTTCVGPTEERMTFGEAVRIASTGECALIGGLTDRHVCNENSGTWWIDLDPFMPKQGCNPACVVNVSTGESEVNWRCTGLLPQ
jgi:hypothetical protein